MSLTDRIKPDDIGITTFLEDLLKDRYQIPTFQRDVVWRKENVKKLWDSIYKFYPLGSILIWKTDVKLHNHRQVGGFELISNINVSEYQYILDGQQRTTSLLTSIYGGKIKDLEGFDPTIYVDLTISNSDDVDDVSYKKRFLYWDEIDDKEGKIKANTGKMKKFKDGLIQKLFEIKKNYKKVFSIVFNHPDVCSDLEHTYVEELLKIKEVLDNYKMSIIELRGIKVTEVCQIFERINQAGKPLDIFDIVVAKTYKDVTDKDPGFYLREKIDNFKKTNNSNFMNISDLDYLQMIAIIIRENVEDSGISNITNRYLNDIKTEQIEEVWDGAKKAIMKTFDFFENCLYLKSPNLIPYRYFYLTIANYFYKNTKPDYDFLIKYFWSYSFHREDLLSNTRDINAHIKVLNDQKHKSEITLPKFEIDKGYLKKSNYSSKGRLSRAILALLASKRPRDWQFTDREVNASNFFFSVDKPNLHHIFPSSFIAKNPGSNNLNENSLMNIAYLTQLTNIQISDKNPLIYVKDFMKNPKFESALGSHLVPRKIIDWASNDTMPDDALDQFIELRASMITDDIINILKGIESEVFDT